MTRQEKNKLNHSEETRDYLKLEIACEIGLATEEYQHVFLVVPIYRASGFVNSE